MFEQQISQSRVERCVRGVASRTMTTSQGAVGLSLVLAWPLDAPGQCRRWSVCCCHSRREGPG